MARGKGGPSGYCADNQANMSPRTGRSGKTEGARAGQPMPRTHEAQDSGAGRNTGKGKIHSTGKPRYSQF